MRVLVFGANGPTGRHVVTMARAAGHEVTAFVRDAASAAIEGARVVGGDATDGGAVAAAISGHDAVITTLGVRGPGRPGQLMERSLAGIVPAMERCGAQRLIVMSALGVGTTRAQAPWLPRLMYRLLLGAIFRDKEAGERIVEASTLDWTIVHPPLLTNGPLTARYQAAETLALSGFPRVGRADVAHFMVRALVAREWVRKRVIVAAHA